MFRFSKPASAAVWVRSVLAMSPLFLFVAGAVGATPAPAAKHGLALLPNGQIAGWGANEFAQVQAGQGEFVQNPQRISLPGTKALAVAAGSRHSLAVDETGRVWAWGDNSSGQLGLGHTKPVTGMALVTDLPVRASFIAAGAQHSMALLTDGTVWVWGANNLGQLGRGAADAFAVQPRPARITTLGRVVDVASGNDFALALVGQRDRNGSANGAVWVWGAGTGVPHAVDGLQSAAVVRAAGDLAMARTTTGGSWQWRPEHTVPGIAQRTAFDKLGEVTHPLLAALTTAPSATVAAAGPSTVAVMPQAAAPVRAAATLTPAATPAAAVSPIAVDVATAPVSSPARPAAALPAATAPVPVAPQASATTLPAPVLAAPPAAALATILSLSGTVRLSAGFGGDNTGKVLENVQVVAEGAQCSATDSQGRYVCSVPAGWTGRVTLRRGNYRFSPSALSFQNLRLDAGQQDFAAIYDPR